ncbi:MAG: AAA family ATPase [Burkholderiaceae bacterium]
MTQSLPDGARAGAGGAGLVLDDDRELQDARIRFGAAAINWGSLDGVNRLLSPDVLRAAILVKDRDPGVFFGLSQGITDLRVRRELDDRLRDLVKARGAAFGGSGLDLDDRPVPFLLLSQIAATWSPSRDIVKDLVGPGEIITVFGESGVKKTFIAAKLAFCVAAGIEFHGRPVEQTGVLMVAGEGIRGANKRLAALRRMLGSDEEIPLAISQAPAPILGGEDRLIELIGLAEAAMGSDVGLVIFDTFSTNFGNGDEDNNRDMARAMRTIKEVIGDQRTALLVHHPGHGAKDRERGAYNLIGNADRRYRVISLTPECSQLECLKTKDEARPDPLVFDFERVGSGLFDADGQEEMTLVAVPSSAAPQKVSDEPVGKVQRAVLFTLERRGPMTKSDLVSLLKEQGHAGKSAAYDAISKLMEHGKVLEAWTKLYVEKNPPAGATDERETRVANEP